MTNELLNMVPEHLRGNITELYEQLCDFADEAGVVIISPRDIERMFGKGREKLDALVELGLVQFDLAIDVRNEIYKILKFIDLRK